MFYTAVTHRPVHAPTSLLWPFSSYPQQTAREDTTACIYLGSSTELSGQTMGLLMWLWPPQPQVWLSTAYEPHCKSDSLYNLHYAAGFGASMRTLGVIQAGLSSSVESQRFLVGVQYLSHCEGCPSPPSPPLFREPPHSPASVFTWHCATLHL